MRGVWGHWAAWPAWSRAAGVERTDRDGRKETKNVCPTSSFFGLWEKGETLASGDYRGWQEERNHSGFFQD